MDLSWVRDVIVEGFDSVILASDEQGKEEELLDALAAKIQDGVRRELDRMRKAVLAALEEHP